jgi:hypothetical protein
MSAMMREKLKIRIRVTVFNATFNNISFILWQSVLLVDENEDVRTVVYRV